VRSGTPFPDAKRRLQPSDVCGEVPPWCTNLDRLVTGCQCTGHGKGELGHLLHGETQIIVIDRNEYTLLKYALSL